MDFDTWITDAWNRHADAPAAVLAELATTGASLGGDDAAVGQLLHLAQHIAGAHQGGPAELAAGRALLATLAALPTAGAPAAAAAAVHDRALALTGGDAGATTGLPVTDAVRVTALAASNLADREPLRAARLLADAVAAVADHPLPDSDPAVRALAVAGNNIAAALEERPARDAASDALMLQAAEIGLRFWRRAGTWLHEERAHHRLALCALAAGAHALARQHAEACLAIVQREGDPPLEAFFAWQALARVEGDEGHSDARARALAHATAQFERLSPDDQAWCRPTLVALQG